MRLEQGQVGDWKGIRDGDVPNLKVVKCTLPHEILSFSLVAWEPQLLPACPRQHPLAWRAPPAFRGLEDKGSQAGQMGMGAQALDLRVTQGGDQG